MSRRATRGFRRKNRHERELQAQVGARGRGAGARQALADPHLCRPFGRPPPPTRSTGPTWRAARPGCRSPSTCRPRPATTRTTRWRKRRGRQGRRAGRPSGRHGDPAGRHPAGAHEQLHDHQRHGALAAGALRRGGRAPGRGPRPALGHDPERHPQGVPVPRHPHLPAPGLHEADDRRDRVYLPRDPQVEPDQRLLLPPAGGRRHAGPGAGLRAGQRHRGAGRGQGLGPGALRGLPARGRAHLLLRQRRPALRHRAVQDARLRRAVGPDLPRALRRHGRQIPALPLWRAGEFPGPDRAAAREQRLPHPAGDAGRRAVQGRAGPGGPAACLERGARSAAALGPAVVAQAAADPRLRDRPAGARRHLHGLGGDRCQGGGTGRRRRGGAGRDRAAGRRRQGGRVGLHEAAPGREQRAAPRGHRERPADRGRRQRLHGVRAPRR